MFNAKFILRYLFCLLLLSCDEFPLDYEYNDYDYEYDYEYEDDDTIERALLSTTGERFEHYFFELDPRFLLYTINLRSSTVLGFQHEGLYAFNQLTIYDVFIRDLVNNIPFTSHVEGTIAVSGRDGVHSVLYSFPIHTEATFFPAPLHHNPEPFRVLSAFENSPGSLILPFTGNYATTFAKHDWRTFSINLSADFLLSLVLNEAETFYKFFAGQERTFTIDGFFPTELSPLSQEYVRLIPQSRNFFQYRNFTATFSPYVEVSNINSSPIVYTVERNYQNNTITVYFHPYDAPYTGSVISFDVNGERRFIRIEGTEN